MSLSAALRLSLVAGRRCAVPGVQASLGGEILPAHLRLGSSLPAGSQARVFAVFGAAPLHRSAQPGGTSNPAAPTIPTGEPVPSDSIPAPPAGGEFDLDEAALVKQQRAKLAEGMRSHHAGHMLEVTAKMKFWAKVFLAVGASAGAFMIYRFATRRGDYVAVLTAMPALLDSPFLATGLDQVNGIIHEAVAEARAAAGGSSERAGVLQPLPFSVVESVIRAYEEQAKQTGSLLHGVSADPARGPQQQQQQPAEKPSAVDLLVSKAVHKWLGWADSRNSSGEGISGTGIASSSSSPSSPSSASPLGSDPIVKEGPALDAVRRAWDGPRFTRAILGKVLAHYEDILRHELHKQALVIVDDVATRSPAVAQLGRDAAATMMVNSALRHARVTDYVTVNQVGSLASSGGAGAAGNGIGGGQYNIDSRAIVAVRHRPDAIRKILGNLLIGMAPDASIDWQASTAAAKQGKSGSNAAPGNSKSKSGSQGAAGKGKEGSNEPELENPLTSAAIGREGRVGAAGPVTPATIDFLTFDELKYVVAYTHIRAAWMLSQQLPKAAARYQAKQQQEEQAAKPAPAAPKD